MDNITWCARRYPHRPHGDCDGGPYPTDLGDDCRCSDPGCPCTGPDGTGVKRSGISSLGAVTNSHDAHDESGWTHD